MKTYRYNLNSTNDSSAKYGNCEVCDKHAPEVWSQVQERSYVRPDGTLSWTQSECHNLFGHHECLLSKQI
jgi:hypothetical protein